MTKMVNYVYYDDVRHDILKRGHQLPNFWGCIFKIYWIRYKLKTNVLLYFIDDDDDDGKGGCGKIFTYRLVLNTYIFMIIVITCTYFFLYL